MAKSKARKRKYQNVSTALAPAPGGQLSHNHNHDEDPKPSSTKALPDKPTTDNLAREQSGSESDPDVEDTDGALAGADFDADVFKTIGAIRSKDKRLYDKNHQFFTKDLDAARKAWAKEKAAQAAAEPKSVTISQVTAKALLANGADYTEDKEDQKMFPKTYVQEQEDLKADVMSAFHNAVELSSDDESEDGFIVRKSKTVEEEEQENNEYRDFVYKNISDDMHASEVFKEWIEGADIATNDPKEAFLKSYIVNRAWQQGSKAKADDLDEMLNNDGANDWEAASSSKRRGDSAVDDEFARLHNLTVKNNKIIAAGTQQVGDSSSLRRADTRRKEARKRRAENKRQEKQQQAEELKRLKNQKKKEILDRVKHIQEITGNSSTGFGEIDLDAEFDPEKHDALMDQAFGDDYYGQDDSGIPDNYQHEGDPDHPDASQKRQGKQPAAPGDDDFVMDADFMPGGEHYKRSNKVTLDQLPEDAKRDALDELYRLEYEDMIDDIPVRYSYSKVEQDDLGLTPTEILLADDEQLDAFCSRSSLAPFKPQSDTRGRYRSVVPKADLEEFYASIEANLKKLESQGPPPPSHGKTKGKVGKKGGRKRAAAEWGVEDMDASGSAAASAGGGGAGFQPSDKRQLPNQQRKAKKKRV
ncbi:Ribosome biogenesis protein Kri1 [Dimargaris verticillata]|uniref:Ribosome biogenesis protein Kri1 n=1 Tax=Dimargaris verticillata TaxID=2761393 RepID=A0A9W8EBS6_9FUNG|nr:Ribosome biogenesis protein Kri1 [Dimargaris verticillata]